MARIVSKVAKLISVEEEAAEAEVAQGGVEVLGVALLLNFWQIIAQGQTEMGNSCQLRPLSAVPAVNLYFPPFLSNASNIYMACGVCVLCVCA